VKQGDILLPLLFNLAVECAMRKVQENGIIGIEGNMEHVSSWYMLMIYIGRKYKYHKEIFRSSG
jgi:hypothetical protein